jgi:hypothetical protein
VQDLCSVCVKHTIGSQGDKALVELCSIGLEIVLILTQDWCMVALNVP